MPRTRQGQGQGGALLGEVGGDFEELTLEKNQNYAETDHAENLCTGMLDVNWTTRRSHRPEPPTEPVAFEQTQYDTEGCAFSEEDMTGILPGFGSYNDRNLCHDRQGPEGTEHEFFWKEQISHERNRTSSRPDRYMEDRLRPTSLRYPRHSDTRGAYFGLPSSKRRDPERHLFLISLPFMMFCRSMLHLDPEDGLRIYFRKFKFSVRCHLGPTGALRIPLNHFTQDQLQSVQEAQRTFQENNQEFEIYKMSDISSRSTETSGPKQEPALDTLEHGADSADGDREQEGPTRRSSTYSDAERVDEDGPEAGHPRAEDEQDHAKARTLENHSTCSGRKDSI